jgi:nucleoside-diphosphate-sugar epimerase
MARHYLVTGGAGFLGSALVRRLIRDGHRVRVLDDGSRGAPARLADLAGERRLEIIAGDVREPGVVRAAARGVDSVAHLAFVNGTEFFYTKPDLVLDVGVKGIVNVLDACIQERVRELIVASSSEVYQDPPRIPTDESAPLVIPDPFNPRYSYAAGKIISEIMAINYGRTQFDRVVIFRPHNVYGPAMGWEHVIPQFCARMREAARATPSGPVPFPIQGDGQQTRSFVFIDDFTDGLALVIEKAAHLSITHIGTTDEVSIEAVARLVARHYGREIRLVPQAAAAGGTPRRCPDIARLTALGFRPRVGLAEGIAITARWYDENADSAPRRALA